MTDDKKLNQDVIQQYRWTIEHQQQRLYQEIAERGEIHHQLLTLLEQQQAILSSIPALIYIRDTEDQLVTANERFLHAFHLTDTALPLPLTPGIKADGLEILLQEDPLVLGKNSPVILEERQIRLDSGATVWLWVSKIPFHSADRQVLGLVGSIFDISDIKHTHFALQQSENLFRTLTERSFSAIFIAQNLELKYINPLFHSHFSIPATANPATIDFLNLFSTRDTVKLKQKCQAIEQEGLESSRFLLNAQPVDKSTPLIFEVYLTQIEYSYQPAVLGSLLDVTDKYLTALAMENKTREVEELNQRLEQRIQEELHKHKQNENLLLHQSRLAAMGEMINAIAHNWRQPLTTLSILIQNLENAYHFSGIDEATLKQFLRDSQQQITRMTDGIDQFSHFFAASKSESVPITMASLLQDSIFIFSRSFPDSPIRVTLPPSLHRQVWRGHTNAFKQVMISLLGLTSPSVPDTMTPVKEIVLDAQKRADHVLIRLLLPLAAKDPQHDDHRNITLEMCRKLVTDHMQGKFDFKKIDEDALEFFIELPLK